MSTSEVMCASLMGGFAGMTSGLIVVKLLVARGISERGIASIGAVMVIIGAAGLAALVLRHGQSRSRGGN